MTASQSLPTQLGNCPIEEWGQCGGDGYVGKCAGSCGNNSVCKYKDGESPVKSPFKNLNTGDGLLMVSFVSLVLVLQQTSSYGSRCRHCLSVIIAEFGE